MERLLLNRGKKSVIGRGYAEFNIASDMTTDCLRQVWNNDLDLTIDETTWAEIRQLAKEISICNRTEDSQFRILHHLQVTSQLRHRMNPSLSEMCSKCYVEVGSYRHCVWSCVHMGYWGKITDKLNLIFDVHLDPVHEVLLLGLPSPHIKGSKKAVQYSHIRCLEKYTVLMD